MLWKAQPADYTSYPLFNVTFEEILPHAGMDEPAFRARFMQRLSFGRLALYYARHPSVAYRTMTDALSKSGRQHDFGNFDISTGCPPSTQSRSFALWSDVKRHFFYHHGDVFLFTYVGLAAWFGILLGLERKRLPEGAWIGGACLIGAAFLEMATSTLCDSMDITRHSMIFFVLFDMIALACVYLTIHRVCGVGTSATIDVP